MPTKNCSFTTIKMKWMRTKGDLSCTWKLMDSAWKANYVLKSVIVSTSLEHCSSIVSLQQHCRFLYKIKSSTFVLHCYSRKICLLRETRNQKPTADPSCHMARVGGSTHKLNINVDQWCILISDLCFSNLSFHGRKACIMLAELVKSINQNGRLNNR